MITNKMTLIRSVNFNLFIEIVVRILLMTAFCYMETMQPFERIVTKPELEANYIYPPTAPYVDAALLWTTVLAAPCALSVMACLFYNDCNDALEILLAWSLALGINGILTDMLKLIVGRPRPDFFYRCFPDGKEAANLLCTGDDRVMFEGRKSFPSGHSSLSFCSFGIAAVWLCGRLGVLSRGRGSGLRVVTCLAPLVWASCVALSRMCDYHHHWEDIAFGSALGFITAVFCYRQYYNPLTSELAGTPYIVSNMTTKYFGGKPDVSPVKVVPDESAPLLSAKKEDKWI